MMVERNCRTVAYRRSFKGKEAFDVITKNYVDNESIVSDTAIDGSKILYIKKNGKERRMNSLCDPSYAAARWAEQFEIKDIHTVCLFFGLGNGEYLRSFLKKKRDDTAIIVYEPDPSVFEHVMREYDLTDILSEDRVILVVKDINEAKFESALYHYVSWVNYENTILAIHPYYLELYQSEYSDMVNIWEKVNLNIVLNYNTVNLFGTKKTINTLYAMSRLNDAGRLSDFVNKVDPDVPVIIVSAGPSLKKNIGCLKQAQGRAIIVATDRIVGYMIENDIIPDLIATADATKESRFLDYEEIQDKTLLCYATANKESLQNHRGRMILFGFYGYMNELMKRLGKQEKEIYPGGSVATAIFSVFETLGTSKFILIGQDLAFEGKNAYADGAELVYKSDDEMFVEGITGEKVLTRADWVGFLKYFEERINERGDEIEVIDATEGGALIHGSRVMSLEEAISEYCTKEYDIRPVFEDFKPALDKEEFDKFVGYMADTKEDIRKIISLAETGKSLTVQLIKAERNNSLDNASNRKIVERLDELQKNIVKVRALKLLEEFLAGEAQKVLKGVYTCEDKDSAGKVYQQAYDLYDIYIGKGSELIEEIEKAGF